MLGVLTAADFVGDKIPAVDHVLHSIGGVIAPISGAVLFKGETDATLVVSLLAGGSTAEAVHAVRSAVRPLSTVTTAGIGNPVLSLLEDLGSALLTLFAFVVPVLAVLAVVAMLVLGLILWRPATEASEGRLSLRRPPSRGAPPGGSSPSCAQRQQLRPGR